MTQRGFTIKDYTLIAAIWLVAIAVCLLRHDMGGGFLGDPAIAMRYALHLADGHGVVWNVGERPVDGATNFLFMGLVAGLIKQGLSVEVANRLLGVLAHVATATLVYLAARQIYASRRWLAVFAASWFALGPGFSYVQAGFGTTFFTLFVCLAWYFACLYVKQPRGGFGWGFSAASLVAALTRPEGALLALLMLAGIGVERSWRGCRNVVVPFVLTFGMLGGAYFGWRWAYFGYPLPNPFYKKGGGTLHWASLTQSASALAVFGFPFLPAYLFRLRPRSALRGLLFSGIPILGFLCLWVLLTNETNYFWRFQYPVLPILLISSVSLYERLFAERKRAGPVFRKRPFVLGGLLVMVALLSYQGQRYRYVPDQSSLSEAGVLLGDYRDKGYVLATSEAGLLPFYSGYKTIDAWGLNDPWITHHGGITEEYLDRYKPHIIVFYAPYFPLFSAPPPRHAPRGTFRQMVMTLWRYAEDRGYVLAAAFGDSVHKVQWYYVHPDFPDSEEIVRRIRDMRYVAQETGREAVNFAR